VKVEILETLHEKGKLDYRQIAELLGKSPKSVSGRLSELEQMGLVEKAEGGYVLTEKGKKVLELVQAGVNFNVAVKQADQTISIGLDLSRGSREFSRYGIFTNLNKLQYLMSKIKRKVKITPRAVAELGMWFHVVTNSAEKELNCNEVVLDILYIDEGLEEVPWLIAICKDTNEPIAALDLEELFRYLEGEVETTTKKAEAVAIGVDRQEYR